MAGPGNYEIGYGKPPREHRFKKGISGNPNGRPKGRKNTKTEIQEVFNQTIKLKSGGKLKEVTAQKAILLKLLEKALSGDLKAIEKALTLTSSVSEPDSDAQDDAALDNQDLEILEAFEEAIRSVGKGHA